MHKCLFLLTLHPERGLRGWGGGGGEKQAAASVKLMMALEMSARRRTFDILHHSQLVFSAEMSDQLTALPLTFNRKDGDTDAGVARLDGGTERQMDSCVPACTDLLCFHLDPACSHGSMQSPSQTWVTFPDAAVAVHDPLTPTLPPPPPPSPTRRGH